VGFDWWRRAWRQAGRGLAQAVLSQLACIPLLIASVLSIAFLLLGFGVFLTPPVLLRVRSLAQRQRRWAWQWSGVQIAAPYRPQPANQETGLIGQLRRCRWLLTDPATWRDLLWNLANIPVGLVLGLIPMALLVQGIEFIGQSAATYPFYQHSVELIPAGLAAGLAALAAGSYGAPWILKTHAQFCAILLAPTRGQLTESRAQVRDTAAAELRRIERDLHDGPQARLAALGMNIGLAEQLVRDQPDQAIELLIEARMASDQALAELRRLVRGILPPVLAERGLDGAVRALAVSLPLPVDVDIELTVPLSAPQESALYFAIAEALANVVKHSQATRAWVRIRDGSIVIGDDGTGGADPAKGTGLTGLRARLAAYDGTVTITSPLGGPTILTMELPCAS
jgi:signal transduction histidine kinase